MNSLFDPECHRQVLGSRKEARNEKGEEGKKEKDRVREEGEEGEPVMQGGPGSVVAEALGRASLPEHRFPPAGVELRDGKQADCCFLQPYSLGP